MKCIIYGILGILLVSNVARSFDMQFMNEMIECGQSMGINADEIKDMMAKHDEKLGCVNACVLKKIGGMVDGKIHLDTLYGILDQHKDSVPNYSKVREDLQACYEEVTSAGDLPECQSARKLALCMHDHLQEVLSLAHGSAQQLGSIAGGLGQINGMLVGHV